MWNLNQRDLKSDKRRRGKDFCRVIFMPSWYYNPGHTKLSWRGSLKSQHLIIRLHRECKSSVTGTSIHFAPSGTSDVLLLLILRFLLLPPHIKADEYRPLLNSKLFSRIYGSRIIKVFFLCGCSAGILSQTNNRKAFEKRVQQLRGRYHRRAFYSDHFILRPTFRMWRGEDELKTAQVLHPLFLTSPRKWNIFSAQVFCQVSP